MRGVRNRGDAGCLPGRRQKHADEFLALWTSDRPDLRINDAEVFSQEAALAFLTRLTDPRSIYRIPALVLRVTTTLDVGRALLTNSTLTKHVTTRGDEARMRLAIPTDLPKGDCAWTRAWLLAPADGEENEGCWRVVAKAFLLGEPDIMGTIDTCTAGNEDETNSGASLRTMQIIVG